LKELVIDNETKVKCEYTIEDKKRNGKYECFYENGIKKESGFYSKNLKEGAVIEYYENGNMKSQSEYKNGVRDGLYQSFYDDGKLYGRVTYSKGIRNGFYERFDSLNQSYEMRVEYISTPNEQKDYKFSDYVNRVWIYIDGDTNFVSVDSDIYSIKSNNNNTGITIKSHFSGNSSKEGDGIDKVFLLIGHDNKKDTIDLNYRGQKRVDYYYKYSLKDIERGVVKGCVVGVDFYEKDIKDSSVLFSNNRRLYFNWSITDEKLINF